MRLLPHFPWLKLWFLDPTKKLGAEPHEAGGIVNVEFILVFQTKGCLRLKFLCGYPEAHKPVAGSSIIQDLVLSIPVS